MSLFTKSATDVFSPVDSSGAQRSVDNAEAQTWGAEVERSFDLAQDSINDQIAAIRGELEGAAEGLVSLATWSELSSTPGARAGQPGRVAATDTGTHVDPVSGLNVRNKGEYSWSGTDWQRVGELDSEAINESLLTSTDFLGTSEMSARNSGLSAGHWVYGTPVAADGYLTSVLLYARSAFASVDVCVYVKTGSTFTVVDGKTFSIGAAGVHSLQTKLRVYKGEYVGIKPSTHNSVGYVAGGVRWYAGDGNSFPDSIQFTLDVSAGFSFKSVDPTPRTRAPLTVVVASPRLYVRSKWNDTQDLVQRFTIARAQSLLFDGLGDVLIDASTRAESTDLAADNGLLLKASNDDAPPLFYNGTILGGNHGIIGPMVTLSGHGKDSRDVGSVWNDGTRDYVLAKIEGNNLSFISEPTGTATRWRITGGLAGSTLTHVSGAINTGNIDAATSVISQLYPTAQRYSRSMQLDGVTLEADGLYEGTSLSIVESYGIPNVVSAVNYLKAGAGSASARNANDPVVQSQVEVRQSRTFNQEGACTFVYDVEFVQEVDINYIAASQAQAMTPATGERLLQYVPRTGVNADTGLDPSQVVDITGITSNMNIRRSEWLDPSNPPDRFVQFIESGGQRKAGFAIGYSLRIGDSVPDKRMANVDLATHTSASSKKQYPRLVDSAVSVDAGDTFTGVGYRAYFCPPLDTDLTVKVNYTEGNKEVVVIDTHNVLNRHWVNLPHRLIGREVTVVQKSSSLTLHSAIVGANGICISNSSGIGELVVVL